MSSLIKPTEEEMITFIKVAEYLGENDKQVYNTMYLIGFMFSSIICLIIYILTPSRATNKDE